MQRSTTPRTPQALPTTPTAQRRPGDRERPADPAVLLSRCRQGDAAAWEQLVGRYQWLVFNAALRSGLTREDAADVTQATFLSLLESLDQVRDGDRVASWLMTVCRRLSWAVHQKSSRESPDEQVEQDEEPPSDLDAIDRWERLTVLHDALDLLGSPCRDLLHALYFDPAEPSYREIAAGLGRRIGSIGPLRARCLSRLREIIGDEVL